MKVELHKFGNSLISRGLAKEIVNSLFFDKDFSNTNIDLDFRKVEMIGTSFTHELLSNMIENKTIKKINFVNTNETATLQLRKVLLFIQEQKRDLNQIDGMEE